MENIVSNQFQLLAPEKTAYVENYTSNPPMPDETLIDVDFCGICQSDVVRYMEGNKYMKKEHGYNPCVLGHEFSGHDERGFRYTIFPLIPCMNCHNCENRQYNVCTDYKYYGSRLNGGMQQRLAIKNWNLIPIPHGVSQRAGAMLEPFSIAQRAVSKTDPAELSVVYGSGVIGTLIAAIHKSRGEEVIAVVHDFRKKDFIEREFEIPAICTQTQDLTPFFGKAGNVYECTGRSTPGTRDCINLLAPQGTFVMQANPQEDITIGRDEWQSIMRKEAKMVGIWNTTRRDWDKSICDILNEKVDPTKLITHEFYMREAEKGFKLLKQRDEMVFKVMLHNC
jgi:L-iditol 2-dehydrogenase